MLNHKGTITLYTERLVLRPFKDSDVNEMYDNWCSDESVAKYTTWYAHKSVDDTKQFLDFLLNQNKSKNNYDWAIEMNGKVIGSINVCEINEAIDLCGIGYCLGYDYWRKGIIIEASKEVIKFLFNEVGFRRIIATHDSENVSSGMVMPKIGMKYEGTLKENILCKDGSFGDHVMYGLLKKDYYCK